MADNSGNKVSLPEYTARAIIDIAQKAATPILTMAAGYVVYFHGHDISEAIREKIRDHKIKKSNK